jgi:hypothetical protein
MYAEGLFSNTAQLDLNTTKNRPINCDYYIFLKYQSRHRNAENSLMSEDLKPTHILLLRKNLQTHQVLVELRYK